MSEHLYCKEGALMAGIHGGDIYRNKVKYDFSVNINPLGMPEAVKEALERAVRHSSEYPDIRAEELRKAVAEMLSTKEENLLFGNGASELFMAVVHALKPRKTVIPVPSFYGYEHAAKAAYGEIKYFFLKEEDGFQMTDKFLEELTEDTDMLFLANPNNPTGVLTDKNYLIKLLDTCKERGIWVVLDECFIDFCSICANSSKMSLEKLNSEVSFLSELENFENLMIVRAFTKIFAIPGVRLGFLLCSSLELRKKIAAHLPEWNLSIFAQEAGIACAGQRMFIEKTRSYVEIEKKFLTKELKKVGFAVYPSKAGFILFKINEPVRDHSMEERSMEYFVQKHSECENFEQKHSGMNYLEKYLSVKEGGDRISLKETLLKKGILIRDCSNFRGLSEGYYRIAVKRREENEILLKAMRELL